MLFIHYINNKQHLNKHFQMNFTEKYKNHIDELENLKVREAKLSKEVELAYEYKEDLIGKIQFADKQIVDRRDEYHKVIIEIQNEIDKIKSELTSYYQS